MEFYAKIYNKNKFIAVNDSDYESIGKLKNNTIYKIVATQPRNYEFHKKFMALCNLYFQNQDCFINFDHCRKWLTMKAGFYEEIKTPNGVMFEPVSIKFASMDELEFKEVYSKVLDVVFKELGSTKEDIEQELINFM